MVSRDRDIKTVSKAVSIQVAPIDKRENSRNAIANQIRYMILSAVHLGVNRTYLLKCRRFKQLYFHLYSLFVNVATVYLLVGYKNDSAAYNLFRYTGVTEYLALVVIAMLSKKTGFNNLFEDIMKFDNALNIQNHLDITLPVTREWYWMTGSLIYSVFEYVLLLTYVFDNHDVLELAAIAASYVTIMTHDIEQLLFCSLIRTIYLRVRILKAHVAKTVASDDKTPRKKLDQIEALSNRTHLDISSLHKNYEVLHKCAERLNSIMSLPMMIMILTSGLSSILLLKTLIKILQIPNFDQEIKRTVIIYSVTRCIKYTILVVISCYYSSVTTSQVSHIRTMLHDAMNSDQIDKLERRRMKAFFQLTRESEFAYALWGVIRLNMSLPLSYLSLCTTYLVIIVQFSKFID